MGIFWVFSPFFPKNSRQGGGILIFKFHPSNLIPYWKQDSEILSFAIETEMETFEITVLISRLVSRQKIRQGSLRSRLSRESLLISVPYTVFCILCNVYRILYIVKCTLSTAPVQRPWPAAVSPWHTRMCIVLAVHCSVQCSALCGAVHFSVKFSAVVKCIVVQFVQSSAVQFSAVQCRSVQCSAVQCSAVQCSAVLCIAVQCNPV